MTGILISKVNGHPDQVLTIFVWYELPFEGIKSNKYFGDCFLTISQKKQSFRNHCLF